MLIVPLTVLRVDTAELHQRFFGSYAVVLQSIFLAVMSVGIYSLFLIIQNWRHREYFVKPTKAIERPGEASATGHADIETNSITYHALFLVMYLLPVVVLSEEIALPIDHGIEVLHAPLALSGFLVAALILSPEALSATRAALAENDLQRYRTFCWARCWRRSV